MAECFNPTEAEALKKEILSSLHCALPGTMESFDADTQTAVIRPAVPRMPLLRDVPVYMPVSFEVNPGDACLVIFADRDMDKWFAGEEGTTSDRMHSLSDGFAFVGFGRSVSG